MLNVIPPMAIFAVWTTEGEAPTHEELVERLGKVGMVATAKRADGMRATLMTWHHCVLAKNGADGIVITDLPKKIPGLDACAACVAAKLVHFPLKESCKSVP